MSNDPPGFGYCMCCGEWPCVKDQFPELVALINELEPIIGFAQYHGWPVPDGLEERVRKAIAQTKPRS